MQRERLNIYLNLDDPIDSEIWDLIKDKKKKSTYVKTLLYNIKKGLPQETNTDIKEDSSEKLSEEDIKDIEGIDFE